jgi:hypothetical protein
MREEEFKKYIQRHSSKSIINKELIILCKDWGSDPEKCIK